MKKMMLFLIFFYVFLVSCTIVVIDDKPNAIPEMESGFGGILKSQCESARGHWNECGSPCAGMGADVMCAAVCQTQCECGGIAGFGCPNGFTCRLSGEIVDEVGICIPN